MSKDLTVVKPATWSAVDGLGRVLPEHDSVGAPREKFVGMFFWTWHNKYDDPENAVNKVWKIQSRGIGTTNVQKVLDEFPEAKNDYHHPAWKGCGYGHWNEPIYGFYHSTDEWVLRRQAELLANALIDVVIFDNTNGSDTWESGYMATGRAFEKAQKDGVNVPHIAFMLPLHEHWMGAEKNNEINRIQMRDIYQKVYQKGLFKDVWFYWKGKPLICGYPGGLNPNDPLDCEILEFFTFRPIQPEYFKGQDRPNQWGWLSAYPQAVYNNADGTPEQITVGIAQNATIKGQLMAMSGFEVMGRTYTSKGFDTRENAKLYGANFQEQWDRALRVDPEFVFVTGWNEWIAGRLEVRWDIPNGFGDQFCDECSRDIEPSKGDLKDHYYYQLCANVRKYKGIEPPQEPLSPVDLTAESIESALANGAIYPDYQKDLSPRDAEGYYHYQNNSGRNAITQTRVFHDTEYLYVQAICQNTISDSSENNWMRLLIKTVQKSPTFEGFHYIINRQSPQETAVLERSLGGWNWEEAARCEYSLTENTLLIKIPLTALQLSDLSRFNLWLKWCDNNLGNGDILSVYTEGDASPGGRFAFAYRGLNNL